MPASLRPARLSRLRLAAPLVLLALGGLLFPAAGTDDAHISFSAARALAEHGALLNLNGEAVEISSSLSFVVLLAGLHALSGWDLVTIGWLVGIAGGLATLVLLGRLCHRASFSAVAAAVPLCCALSVPLTYWSFSGMETSLAAACTLAVVLAFGSVLQHGFQPRPAGVLALALGAYLAVRPESTPIAVCVAGGLLTLTIARRRRTPGPTAQIELLRASLLLFVVLSFAACLAVWRWRTFGELLPHPVAAKTGGELLRKAREGITYLVAEPYWTSLHVLAIVQASSIVRRSLRGEAASPHAVLAGGFVLAQLAFAVLSGGDWMEGARFLAPTLPLAWFASATMAQRLLPARALRPLAIATCLGLCGATLLFARSRSRSLPAWLDAEARYHSSERSYALLEERNKVHLRDMPTIDALSAILDVCATDPGRRTWILSGQGGMVLHHALAGRSGVGVIDRYGLQDRILAASPTVRAAGKSRLGLRLSWPYLLENWERIAAECGASDPDVVLDVSFGPRARDLLAARGYVLAFEQTGVVRPAPGFLAGDDRARTFQPAGQAIFVKRALAARLAPDLRRTFEFSPAPFDARDESASAPVRAPAPRPHVVVLLADDLGWGDVSWNGSEFATPRLAELCRAGIELQRLYAQPMCSPTRAALLTARYPIRYGLQVGVVRPWSQGGLDPGERTLAQALREVGYATHAVGKWHLGNHTEEYLPLARGFDHHYGSYTGLIDHFTHERDGGLDWHRDGEPVRETGYATRLLADEAVRVVRAHDARRPLFLYAALVAPHYPLQAPPETVAAFASIADESRRVYAAMVAELDDAAGRIAAALDERDMADDTLFVFLSDNGGFLREGASNAPLRGQKGQVHEGGVRVPAFVRWPASLPSGERCATPLHVVDLAATIAARAGARLGAQVDGLDVLTTLRGGAPPTRDVLLLDSQPRQGALLAGDWKLVVRTAERTPGAVAADPLHGVELYDLAADPGETRDRSADQAERARELLQRLAEFSAAARPPLGIDGDAPPGFVAPAVWGPPR